MHWKDRKSNIMLSTVCHFVYTQLNSDHDDDDDDGNDDATVRKLTKWRIEVNKEGRTEKRSKTIQIRIWDKVGLTIKTNMIQFNPTDMYTCMYVHINLEWKSYSATGN